MKILLLEPHLGVKRPSLYRFFYYGSLALEQVAALTPSNHDLEIVIETFKEIDFNNNYDLVGISCLTCNAIRGYEIADKFRKRNITVVFGGYHASILPEEVKQHADSVVIGEAEQIWEQLLIDFQNKKLKPFYKSTKFTDPDKIPPPRRITTGKPMYASIQATRGCPNRCKFCAMQMIEGSIFRPRPIKNIVEEIREIKCKNLFFVDSSMTLNPNYSKSLFKEIKEFNKRIECFGNINVFEKDEKFLKLASDAGCFRWLIGIESISQKTINNIGKFTNKVEKYAKAIKNIQDYGMMVTGLFMFGFDSDTKDVFDKTIEAINKWNLDSIACSILTPYPGTPLFYQLKNENRIFTYDWSKYTEGNVNFKPKNFTEKELITGVKKIVSDFYSYSNSIKRCMRSKYLDFPILSRKIIGNFIVSRIFYKELLDLL